MLALLSMAAQASVVFQTGFTGAYQAVPDDSRLFGALPAGWSDNSTWAPVSLQYSQNTEAGRTFLPIRIADGSAQLFHGFPFPGVFVEDLFGNPLPARQPLGRTCVFAGGPYTVDTLAWLLHSPGTGKRIRPPRPPNPVR